MNKISHYILKYWYIYLLALVFMIFQVGLDMLTPQVTKSIVDDVIGLNNLSLLTPLLVAIFIIGAGRCVFGYFKEYLFDWLGSKIGTDIRRSVFRYVQRLSVNFFDKTNTGEIMSRIKNDVDNLWGATGFIGMLIMEVTLHTALIIFCMINLSPVLTIVPVIALPVCGAFAIIMEKKLDKVYEDISEENAVLNTVAQENLAGVRTVKSFAREKFEIGKFLSHNNRYYELNMKQSKVFIRYNPLFQLVSTILPIITVIMGGKMVIDGEITLGTLAAFVAYSTNIVWPMEMLGWLSNEFASAIASYKKLKKICTEVPVITDPVSPIQLETVTGSVRFDNVSLKLGDTGILSNISFDLPAGKTLGIMGATGSGKTSIINMMQRFYDVSDGAIFLDDVDIRSLSLGQLRKSFACVMQDVFLFSDTIKANVRMGNRDQINDEAINDALEKSQASEFVNKLSDGTDTLIGERGVGLSGGQKQRLSIARAFSKRAPILVLDDSTSALDMETEQLVQRSLDELKDTTKIIIAHRISAVRRADEIIVLENNTIAERGTHDELLAQHGLYYQTYLAQYGELPEESLPTAVNE